MAACALLLLAACGAGSRRTLLPSEVDGTLAALDAANPFDRHRLAYVITGDPELDAFFRAAAALQGALVLAEEPAGADPRAVARVLRAAPGLAAALLGRAPELRARIEVVFAEDELVRAMVVPAFDEAVGQLRDAARRAPAARDRLCAALRGPGADGEAGCQAAEELPPAEPPPDEPPPESDFFVLE